MPNAKRLESMERLRKERRERLRKERRERLREKNEKIDKHKLELRRLRNLKADLKSKLVYYHYQSFDLDIRLIGCNQLVLT